VLVFQTMAEETKDVPTTETPAAEGETKQENGKKQVKRDETPIEELFDLTKPIPRVREPHDFAGTPCVGFLRTSDQHNRHSWTMDVSMSHPLVSQTLISLL
jgi:hypothetical protein